MYKRIFDFTFSLLFLISFSWWLHIIISIGIKLSSKGSILYRQKRVGQDGLYFYCIKFRTMTASLHAPSSITKKNDPRIFSFGAFLRRSNLDEIPQFINVLLGDMSLVGPRPHMILEDDMLAEQLSKYRMRHWVKPGITGLAAIKGYRGGTEDMGLMQKRIDYDVEYVQSWSLWLDFKICVLTVTETLLGKGKGS